MGSLRLSRLAIFALLLLPPAATQAQEPARRGPQIVAPADGSTVSGPVTVTVGFGAPGRGGPPPGAPPPADGQERRGPRLALFIDSPVPQPGSPVPADPKHVPFPEGQRQVTVTLPPGPHSLQLVMLDREGRVSERGRPSDPSNIVVK